MKFNLSNADLSQLPITIHNLKNISDLDLSNNMFNELPYEILEMMNIIRLILYNNKIYSIDNLKKLQYLNNLDLSKNKITKIQTINIPNSLETLIIYNNPLYYMNIENTNINTLFISNLHLLKNGIPYNLKQLFILYDYDDLYDDVILYEYNDILNIKISLNNYRLVLNDIPIYKCVFFRNNQYKKVNKCIKNLNFLDFYPNSIAHKPPNGIVVRTLLKQYINE